MQHGLIDDLARLFRPRWPVAILLLLAAGIGLIGDFSERSNRGKGY